MKSLCDLFLMFEVEIVLEEFLSPEHSLVYGSLVNGEEPSISWFFPTTSNFFHVKVRFSFRSSSLVKVNERSSLWTDSQLPVPCNFCLSSPRGSSTQCSLQFPISYNYLLGPQHRLNLLKIKAYSQCRTPQL